MTDTLFEYDHILMRSEYRTPDIHSHLALHLIVGLGAGLHCTVAGVGFDADAVFIASDIPHTAYSDSGEMLVFLFDSTSRYAYEINRRFLHGDRHVCLDSDRVQKIRSLWKAHQDSICNADRAILEYLCLSKNSDLQLDERVAEVLTILKEMDEVPEDAQNHCNVGNGKIVLDTICSWIQSINAETMEQ